MTELNKPKEEKPKRVLFVKTSMMNYILAFSVALIVTLCNVYIYSKAYWIPYPHIIITWVSLIAFYITYRLVEYGLTGQMISPSLHLMKKDEAKKILLMRLIIFIFSIIILLVYWYMLTQTFRRMYVDF